MTTTPNETKVVTFRLSESELEDLDKIASEEDRSRSSILVRLVKVAIAQAKEGKFSLFFASNYSQVGKLLTDESINQSHE
jgi:hypothetical protein